MSTKKLINKAEDVVEEMIQGIVACHPSLVRIEGYAVLLRSDYLSRTSEVALLSGGGSGHEPAHAGFIGKGMLSAAVCGGVFASPSVDSILAGIRSICVPGGKGCLLIVKNYTGDRLNFGLAAETCKAEGIPCEMVIVGDDVAVNAGKEDDGTITGRRGLAGTVFVHKCAGAVAEAGGSLAEVAAAARSAAESVGSMGVALTTCTVPGGKPSDRIGENEMELGLGIHNEPGRTKTTVTDVNSIVEIIIEEIDNVMDVKGKAVALMINNLGGTPMLELYVAARAIHQALENRNVVISRSYVGSFMTSLEMQGMMITTCFVDEERLALLDSDTGAPAWPKTESNLMKGTFGRKGGSSGRVVSAPSSSLIGVSSKDIVIESKKGKQIINGIQAAANALIAEEEELTRMDRIVGDGDCGQTFKRGAEAILADLSTYDVEHPSVLCNQLGDSIRKSMGGSSGAILDIMFRAASTNFQDWPTALSNGVKSASFYGGAKVGYRTMLDALIPASEAALVLNSTLESIVVAAGKGAEGTKTMKPLAGRSSYIDQTSTNGTADPGAVAMAIALSAFSVGFKSDSNL